MARKDAYVKQSVKRKEKAEKKQDIAIVGMACRFPGAKNYHEFWNNLERGVNSIREITPDRWNINEYYSPDINEPNKSISKWCGLVDDVDKFDNHFFNISPREANNMDPQQRILLEETWHCIEDSGISLEELRARKTSVFVGVMTVDYRQEAVVQGVETDSFSCLGGYESILANRISYYFDFKGKSMPVNNACASTIIAISEAKRSLESGECDYALVAGVNLNLHPWKYISFSKSRMLSPDGQCKTFDCSANGYVPGDGVGVFLLSRLDDARRLKCNIYGLVKGAAVNHCGRTNSITAPSIEAQRDVIIAAYEHAGINPETVSYIEAHGTGTALGDPIEIEALTQAFARFTKRKQYCYIGSVKTNIGHLEAAAGAASMVKILIMMKNRKIPPTINLVTVNPIIEFERTPFIIADRLIPWERGGKRAPLRAGVSSFGFGGVNSHVVLEEYVESRKAEKNRDDCDYIFALSAKTSTALEKLANEWAVYIEQSDDPGFKCRDICLTQLTGRSSFPYRAGSIISGRSQMIEFLKGIRANKIKVSEKTPWMLLIGNYEWKRSSAIEKDSEEAELLLESLESIVKNLDESKYLLGLLKEIRAGTLEVFENKVVSFLLQYAYVLLLMDLGFRPEVSAGFGEGKLLSMVIAGMITVEDAVGIVTGKLKTSEVKVLRPDVPYLDPVTGLEIKPVKIDKEYVELLLSSLHYSDEFGRSIIKKARILLQNQYTFKKYMEEWEIEVQKHSLSSLFEALAADEIIEDEYEDKAVKNIVLIAIVSSLKKLNFKWKLKENREGGSKEFFELVDLVCDEVITKEMLIGLLSGRNQDLGLISATMENRQNLLNWNNPYTCLKEKNEVLEKIDLWEWLEQKENGSMAVSLEKYRVFRFGTVNLQGLKVNIEIDEVDDCIRELKKCLLTLWQNGVDINWRKIYRNGTFYKMPLPLYPFEGKSFWVYEKRKTFPENPTFKQGVTGSETRKGLEFNAERPEIRDHVIAGENIVPVAYMILGTMEEIREKVGQEVKAMSGVMVKTPIITGGKEVVSAAVHVDGQRFNLNYEKQQVLSGVFAFWVDEETTDMFHTDIEFPAVKLEREQIYELLSSSGYYYGEAFRVLECGWRFDSGRRVFKLSTEGFEKKEEKVGDLAVGTLMLDGVFQAVLATGFSKGLISGGNHIYIPYVIGRINVYGLLSDACYAVIDESGLENKGGDLYASAGAYDASGKEVFKLSNMVFKRVPKNFLEKYKKMGDECQNSQGIFSYRCCWEEKELDIFAGAGTGSRRNALVFSEGDITGNALVEEALKRYDNVITAVKSRSFQNDGDGTFLIRPEEEKDYLQLAGELSKICGLNSNGCDVFYLWGNTSFEPLSCSGDSLEKAYIEVIQGVFYFLKCLGKSCTPFEINMIVLGLDSQVMQPGDTGRGIAQSGILGFLRTASIETARFGFRFIDINAVDYNDPWTVQMLLDEAASKSPEDMAVYRDKKRFVGAIEQISIFPEKSTKVPESHGVCIITGGAGGIGMRLVEELAGKSAGGVVMLGRSELSEPQIARMNELKNRGIKLEYIRCDVTNFAQTSEVICRILKEYGPITGVIHAAGILEDELIAGKSLESLVRVAKPKVLGAYFLHMLTKEQPLDFFVMFSSVVALIGNAGQADYAAANAFMDAFAHYRAVSGFPGRSLSVNWSLWEDGGMGLTESHKQAFRRKSGVIVSRQAIKRLFDVIDSGAVQCAVVGDASAFEKSINGRRIDTVKRGGEQTLKIEGIQEKIIKILSDILHVSAAELDLDTDIREFGLESVSLNEFAEKVSEVFGISADAALFFEYPDIRRISGYIFEKQKNPMILERIEKDGKNQALKMIRKLPAEMDACVPAAQERYDNEIKKLLIQLLSAVLNVGESELDEESDLRDFGMESFSLTDYCTRINDALGSDIDAALIFEYSNVSEIARYLIEKYPQNVSEYMKKLHDITSKDQTGGQQAGITTFRTETNNKSKIMNNFRDSDVAIIGISGRFPGADDVEEYWENIVANRNMITEIPPDRWDWKEFYGDASGDENKTDVKWGGFLEDILRFDAAFFKISRREAELMDPQQRIMLEEAWHAIEDAGIKPSALAGSRTGVFIGVTNIDYDELLIRNGSRLDAYTSTGFYSSIIPNRISYFLNLKGPSLAIDTACSGALVSVHEAVKAIQVGECEMALAGGINVIITPRRYFSFSNAGMLAKDGNCKTFDARADGYVRGEGAGFVLLKPLKKAVEDGDAIYAVIRGSAVNHGGFVGTLTAPNPNAQAELIVSAYERAGVTPDTVTYIEAHGTGTNLGDPIEINGLKKAFEELYNRYGIIMDKTQYCGIGAVKTNIGHLESAAGIAGLLKLVMSMKYGVLPANINFTEQNPRIKLEGSPFYLITENRKWERKMDETGSLLPRRAGVSSFGFGGVNAHVVVEEFYMENEERTEENKRNNVVVLSAKNRESLKVYAARMAEAFEKKMEGVSFEDGVYTLQTGREALEERLAFVAEDFATAARILRNYVQGKGLDKIYTGFVKKNNTKTCPISAVEKDAEELARLWVSGGEIDWNSMYQDGKNRKIHLPGYPFAEERYWLTEPEGKKKTVDGGICTLNGEDENDEMQDRSFGDDLEDTELFRLLKRLERGELKSEDVKRLMGVLK